MNRGYWVDDLPRFDEVRFGTGERLRDVCLLSTEPLCGGAWMFTYLAPDDDGYYPLISTPTDIRVYTENGREILETVEWDPNETARRAV